MVREMSLSINTKDYDSAEETHPFYKEMVSEMIRQITKRSKKRKLNVLEVGSGTGLFTKELLRVENIEVDCIEIDEECFEYLIKRCVGKKVNLIEGDAVTYSKQGYYDIIISCFAHDHTSNFNNRLEFAKNLSRNLRKKGVYIVGQEIIPKFNDRGERRKSLRTFQGYIVWKAIQDGYEEVAGLELDSLKAAVKENGDWKRHMKMFEQEMDYGGLKEVFRKRIGPLDKEDVGGVYVFVYEKQDGKK